MHELSLVEGLLEQVTRHAQIRAGATVQRVHVRIGEASGVEAELFEAAFAQLCEGTCCQAARLEVSRVAARWTCRRCERDFAPGEALLCERCGTPGKLMSGDELVLDRIELEVSDV